MLIINAFKELSLAEKIQMIDVAANSHYRNFISNVKEEVKELILNMEKSRDISFENYGLEIERLKETRKVLMQFEEINTHILSIIPKQNIQE